MELGKQVGTCIWTSQVDILHNGDQKYPTPPIICTK